MAETARFAEEGATTRGLLEVILTESGYRMLQAEGAAPALAVPTPHPAVWPPTWFASIGPSCAPFQAPACRSWLEHENGFDGTRCIC